MSLPAVRRIITGHDANGKAIIESDTNLTPVNPLTGGTFSKEARSNDLAPFAFTVAYRTSGFPAAVNEPPIEYHGKKIDLADPTGSTCRIVDFPPLEDENLHRGVMHRTQSLDFAVVMKGTIILELDDGLETTVKEGDVIVQRGTIHAWKNVSNENCRMLFVLLPAEKVKVQSTGEYLEKTAMPQLLDEEK